MRGRGEEDATVLTSEVGLSAAVRVKGQARLVCKAEQAWAAAAPSSFLSLLFVANLVRV